MDRPRGDGRRNVGRDDGASGSSNTNNHQAGQLWFGDSIVLRRRRRSPPEVPEQQAAEPNDDGAGGYDEVPSRAQIQEYVRERRERDRAILDVFRNWDVRPPSLDDWCREIAGTVTIRYRGRVERMNIMSPRHRVHPRVPFDQLPRREQRELRRFVLENAHDMYPVPLPPPAHGMQIGG